MYVMLIVDVGWHDRYRGCGEFQPRGVGARCTCLETRDGEGGGMIDWTEGKVGRDSRATELGWMGLMWVGDVVSMV